MDKANPYVEGSPKAILWDAVRLHMKNAEQSRDEAAALDMAKRKAITRANHFDDSAAACLAALEALNKVATITGEQP